MLKTLFKKLWTLLRYAYTIAVLGFFLAMFWMAAKNQPIAAVFHVGLIALCLTWHNKKWKRRRETLREINGGWEWEELSGRKKRSNTHPEDRKGEWTIELEASGDGDGGD